MKTDTNSHVGKTTLETLSKLTALIMFTIIVLLVFGFVTMIAWNSTISQIFGFQEISYFQGIMLQALFLTLFRIKL